MPVVGLRFSAGAGGGTLGVGDGDAASLPCARALNDGLSTMAARHATVTNSVFDFICCLAHLAGSL